MVTAYKFYYFNHEGKILDGLFLSEKEGMEYGDNYELECFKYETVQISYYHAELLR
jgi:hypothetical protein